MTKNDTQPDVSVFLASAVHDMKNSITMLIGFLEKTLEGTEPSAFPGYRDMAHMLYETRRINDNLVQLLTLYKVGNDLYPFDPAPHPLDDFIEEVVSQNDPLLRSKGITLEVEQEADVHWHFDEDLIGGVINHALNNAIHYTSDRVRLVARVVDDFLELRVEDNGSGYPRNMLELGVAAAQGVDFASGSTGLGLYFSSAAARLHNSRGKTGAILLENGGAWGGGCFVVRLP